jgi:murein DD-endopeptidase MepM/ murein hydrolase activator NlpD
MSLQKWTDTQVRLKLVTHWSDDVWRSRSAAHLAVALLLVLTIVLSSTQLISLPKRPAGQLSLSLIPREQTVSTVDTGSFAEGDELTLNAAPVVEDGNILRRLTVPHTIIPDRPRDEITQYVVQPGDTILGIASQFGITGETIMWANGRLEDNPDMLRVGQEVIVLPVNGVYHQVGPNDTIDSIASTFKVEPSAIIDYPLNQLDPENPAIQVGQWVIVPGGTKPYVPKQVAAYAGPVPEDAVAGTGNFGWPASGQISQGYWDRHRALDIAAWLGAPVLAADSGYVVAAGWDDTGYGRVVLIDHGNGYQTLYAHLDKYYVEAGDSVAKGEQIGEMGSTGNSTGPHLHFEIRNNGVQRNPYGFLP